MGKIRLPDGRVVDAVKLDFEPLKECWYEYKLSDGSKLKIKLTVTGVFRTEDYDPVTGEPRYVVYSQNTVIALDIPEKLIKTPKEKQKKKGEAKYIG